MKEEVSLNLNNVEQVTSIAKALSSATRIEILKLLDERAMNISEIATAMNIPVSTAALQIKVLEEAELVVSQPLPGIRGSQKVSGIKVQKVHIDIKSNGDNASKTSVVQVSMPIGNYSDCHIEAPCGIASEKQSLSSDDDTEAFYLPERTTAQIIWFYKGYLEYRFPTRHIKRNKTNKIKSVEFVFEACSEAPGYNNEWPSDITIWINDKEVGQFTSQGDYGGRRGKLVPEWWPDSFTQYGKLYTFSITEDGCYVDNKLTSNENLSTLWSGKQEFISFKIGVKDDSKYVGGINLFGNKFGDFQQNIEMRINSY
ncbi:MAG: helix-turn-helix domain-containing protein [Lachnospiraceae bacterium]|nr:helix-turn-helix domain-containing protein [Lachnospiraceae bacterium]